MAAKISPLKNTVVATQASPNTTIVVGVAIPTIAAATTYAASTTNSTTFQTGQILNRIGDI